MRWVAVAVLVAGLAPAITWRLPSVPVARRPTVIRAHPRLYLTQQNVEAMRARARRPPVSAYLALMRGAMGPATRPSPNREVAAFELESLALLHVLDGGQRYRDRILDGWLLPAYRPGQISHWALPYQVMAHSLALDQLWQELSRDQRRAIGLVIVAMMDDLLGYAPYDVPYANPMSDYSNQLYYHLCALAFAGIVLADEGIDDRRAASYLTEASVLLRERMIPAINQEAGGDDDLRRLVDFTGNGGWGEDMGHLEMTHPFLGRMLEAWRNGTGEDLFPSVNGLATIAQYVTYMTRPGGGLTPKGNASYGLSLTDKNYGTLGCLLAARYRDSLGTRLKQISHSASRTFGFHQAGAVLWCDPDSPEPDLSRLPRAMHFQGQGEVVIRSGFAADDTWIYLHAGPIYNGHQHDDQGNLLIDAYGGELLVEEAGDGLDATRYHNSILVSGREQRPYGRNELQRATPLSGTSQERGRIIETRFDPSYAYAQAQFGQAYADRSSSSASVTREIVSILPDVLVIRDRIAAAGPHQVLFHAWRDARTSLDEAARTFTVGHRGGLAWMKTLHPATARASLSTQSATVLLTITTPANQTATDVVHLVVLSRASAPEIPHEVSLVETDHEIGVITSTPNGRTWAITFDRSTPGLRRADVVR